MSNIDERQHSHNGKKPCPVFRFCLIKLAGDSRGLIRLFAYFLALPSVMQMVQKLFGKRGLFLCNYWLFYSQGFLSTYIARREREKHDYY